MKNPLKGKEWPKLISVRFRERDRASNGTTKDSYTFQVDGVVRGISFVNQSDDDVSDDGSVSGTISNEAAPEGPDQDVFLVWGDWSRGENMPEGIRVGEIELDQLSGHPNFEKIRQEIARHIDEVGAQTKDGKEQPPGEEDVGFIERVTGGFLSIGALSEIAIAVGILIAITAALSQLND